MPLKKRGRPSKSTERNDPPINQKTNEPKSDDLNNSAVGDDDINAIRETFHMSNNFNYS